MLLVLLLLLDVEELLSGGDEGELGEATGIPLPTSLLPLLRSDANPPLPRSDEILPLPKSDTIVWRDPSLSSQKCASCASTTDMPVHCGAAGPVVGKSDKALLSVTDGVGDEPAPPAFGRPAPPLVDALPIPICFEPDGVGIRPAPPAETLLYVKLRAMNAFK